MVEGVFVHEAIKVLGQGTGDFRGATGAGTIHQPLDPLSSPRKVRGGMHYQ